MKTNFDIIPYQFDNEIRIIPLADLHIGAKNCMYKELKETIEYIKNNDNVYFTIGGDLLDNAVLTGKNLGIFDNQMTPIEQVNYAVNMFKDIMDKCLCIIPGNHEDRSEKVTSINPAYLFATQTRKESIYRSSIAILKINIGKKINRKGQGRPQCYTILVHHGTGTSESAIKKDHEFINNFEGIDICTTSHTHNGRVAKFSKYVLNKFSNTVSKKSLAIIISNSFLNDAEYGLKSMLIGSNNELIYYDLKIGQDKKVITHY